MRIVAITQARIASSRLPRKVLLPLGPTTVLGLHLQRLSQVPELNRVVLATTFEDESVKLIEIAQQHQASYYQGSLADVLDRFYQAAVQEKADVVVRLTSDCPLVDPALVSHLVQKFLAEKVDYASNCLVPNLPDGMDCEIFTIDALTKAWKEARLQSEREHVTPYIWKNTDLKGGSLFRGYSWNSGLGYQNYRLTLDCPEDYEVLKAIVNKLGMNANMEETVRFLREHPKIYALNSKIIPNEGYLKSIKEEKT